MRHIPDRIRNRYAFAVMVLIGWILFFDTYDAYTTFKLRRELVQMRSQKEWYQQEIERSKEQLDQLKGDDDLLERFARERYLMKRENEDIFVLVPEE